MIVLHQFPCCSDNYGFLLHDSASGCTSCIDTPDADEISVQAAGRGWSIDEIWNTHWHDDHAGGNAELKERHGCRILAPEEVRERAGAPVDRVLRGGESFNFGAYVVEVHETPGHTSGHIVYHLPDAGAAFVGDTLFSLGCGRLFEGSPEQMWRSLCLIRDFPPQTKLYCAHEYTQANADFALSVDSGNMELCAYAQRVRSLRAENRPTVPTVLAVERECNPFLRADEEGLQRAMGGEGDAVAVFTELRHRKDVF